MTTTLGTDIYAACQLTGPVTLPSGQVRQEYVLGGVEMGRIPPNREGIARAAGAVR